MEKSYSELCLDYIKEAKRYANSIVFWRQEQRDVMQNFTNLILTLHELSKNDKIERRVQRKLPRKMKKDEADETKPRRRRIVDACVTKLNRQLRNRDKNCYKELLGLSDEIFNKLVNLIEGDLRKCITNFRNGIQAEEQLRITLRFLATGETYKSLQKTCGYSHSFTCITIPKVCRVLCDNLKDKYMRLPESHDEWKKIADSYEKKIQFPLCLGALDGQFIKVNSRRVERQKTKNARNIYARKTYNKILLGLVDANYKFIYTHLGANDLDHKNQVLKSSDLQAILENSEIHLPPDDVIGNNRTLPYIIVAGNDFVPQKHLLTSFSSDTLEPSEMVYNQRFNMAKKRIDRAFNILTSRFRILKQPLYFRNTENIDIMISACCILHNFFIAENADEYKNVLNVEDENEKDSLIEYGELPESNYDWMRNEFLEYFNDEGEIEWMEDEDVI